MVHSALGPVQVKLVDSFPDAPDQIGEWSGKARTITLVKGLNPMTAHQTLWHEKVHLWLADAGVKLQLKDEERVCDALSTALLADFLNR